MRMHVVGLPHLQTHSSVSHCAYSQKVRRFADMMFDRGHEVFLYTSDDNDARCTEHISCISKEKQAELFTPPLVWNYRDPLWQHMADNAIREIGKRIEPEDFLCFIAGTQKPVAEAFPNNYSVEFGIGYAGTFAPFRVWESYSWMHSVYGSWAANDVMSYQGHNYDTVIPNSYDPDEFPLGDGSGGYLLYIGRLIHLKGIDIVSAIQKETGMKLIVAGAGDKRPDVPHEYVGVVGPEQRAELMGNAVATLYPTMYLEPFGGVAVETMFTGTPSITSDFGAFPENVWDGYRARTLQDYLDAVEFAKSANKPSARQALRDYAVGRFSTAVVGDMYEKYFERLATLRGKGWYELKPKEAQVAVSI